MTSQQDKTKVSLIELIGLNPRQVRSATILIELYEPVIVEAVLYVLGDDGRPQLSGHEALMATKRFELTEIEEDEDGS